MLFNKYWLAFKPDLLKSLLCETLLLQSYTLNCTLTGPFSIIVSSALRLAPSGFKNFNKALGKSLMDEAKSFKYHFRIVLQCIVCVDSSNETLASSSQKDSATILSSSSKSVEVNFCVDELNQVQIKIYKV